MGADKTECSQAREENRDVKPKEVLPQQPNSCLPLAEFPESHQSQQEPTR